jgi:DNA-binding protein YbaB
VEPNELMSSYLQEVEVLAQQAETAKQQLKQLSGSLTSGDGAVSLTVNAAGALQSLSFGPKADSLPKTQLASLILSTARRAQIEAARQVTSILAPLVGEDSDAMRFVQEQIPVPAEPDDDPTTSEPQQSPPAFQPPRFQPPAPQPAVRARPRVDIDDDYSTSPVTREEDW